ncbi:MAG: TRAP transporter small permease [Desulfobacteraceae bacterium]|jgi:TRAP-type C4-dicarboxylate transport system permease small subunit
MKKKGLFDWVVDSAGFMAGMLLVGTVLIVSFEICMRYFFRAPQVWTVEVCEYFLFFMTFLGAPWLLKVGGHVNIDVLSAQFGKRGQHILGIVTAVIGVLVSAVICWFSFVTTWDCYQSGVVVTKTMTIPKHYFLWAIGFGYLLLLFEFLRGAFRHSLGLREGN